MILWSLVGSSALLLHTIWTCMASENGGWTAIFCGNANGQGLRLIATPVVVAVLGSAASLLVGRLRGETPRTLWALIGVATTATLVGLILFYVLGQPPPGYYQG